MIAKGLQFGVSTLLLQSLILKPLRTDLFQHLLDMMDEVGSRVTHCGEDDDVEPNFRCVPFFYSQKGLSFSLLWPVADVESGDIVTRDFFEGVKSKLQRAARGNNFSQNVAFSENVLLHARCWGWSSGK